MPNCGAKETLRELNKRRETDILCSSLTIQYLILNYESIAFCEAILLLLQHIITDSQEVLSSLASVTSHWPHSLRALSERREQHSIYFPLYDKGDEIPSNKAGEKNSRLFWSDLCLDCGLSPPTALWSQGIYCKAEERKKVPLDSKIFCLILFQFAIHVFKRDGIWKRLQNSFNNADRAKSVAL